MDRNIDRRIDQAAGCDVLNTTAGELQCNVQSPPTMKQETVQCCDENETNCDNHMCGYKSLKSPSCVNYYDGHFSVSVEVKEEFPEDKCSQSSTLASCINKRTGYSKIVFEDEELLRGLEIQDDLEGAFSSIKTEEIHGKKNERKAKTETSEEHRILGNAGNTSALYGVQTTSQDIQPKTCGGIIKNRFDRLTNNKEHIEVVPSTSGDNGMKECRKCQFCDKYFTDENIHAHICDLHSNNIPKSKLCSKDTKTYPSGRNGEKITYKCDSCERIYKSKCALVIHKKMIHDDYDKTFNCWCGRQFHKPSQLHQHKYHMQHGSTVENTNNSALKKEFQCDICKKIFKSKTNLKRHITNIHYDYGKTFKCWCGKQFCVPALLSSHKYHMQHGSTVKNTNNSALETQFQCDICKKIFKTKDRLKTHILNIHYDYGKIFNCWCGNNFRTQKYLYAHKYRQHGSTVENTNNSALKNQFQCDVCKKKFNIKGNLKKHILNIHYDYGKTFDCWCGKQFRTPKYLYTHKYMQHNTKVKNENNAALKNGFRCDICKKKFNTQHRLNAHILNIHYDYGKTFNCWCGKQFRTPTQLRAHKYHMQHGSTVKNTNNSALKQQFQCDICKKMFNRKDHLKRHITSIHYDYGKTFDCWCGKQFRTQKYLYAHKYRQHGFTVENTNNSALKNQYQCDICKKNFKTQYYLKTHILNVHYDYGKTFNCWCGKQFRAPIHLYRHKCRQHGSTVENTNNSALKKEFQCDICKKNFKTQYYLKIHILNVHYDYGKPFDCWCGKQFRTPEQLRTHKYRLHGFTVENTNNSALKNQFP